MSRVERPKCVALRRERSRVAWQRRHMGVARRRTVDHPLAATSPGSNILDSANRASAISFMTCGEKINNGIEIQSCRTSMLGYFSSGSREVFATKVTN